MSVQDAYAPPRAPVRDMSGSTGAVSDRIVSALRKTRPWVLLLAVLGFIFSVLMVIAGVPLLFGAGSMMGNDLAAVGGMGGPGALMALGVFYILSGVIYFMASLYLLRYAGSIKRAVTGLGLADLELAMEQQASFWKLVGILTVVSIVALIALAVLGMGSLMMMGGVG